MKFITLATICTAFLIVSNAQAEVRSIVEWDGGSNPYKPGKMTITGEKLETECSKTCSTPPYSLTTTSCPEDQILVHCPVSGCSYYNYCRPKTLYDENTSPKDDVLYIDQKNLDLMELLNEVESYGQPQEGQQGITE